MDFSRNLGPGILFHPSVLLPFSFSSDSDLEVDEWHHGKEIAQELQSH